MWVVHRPWQPWKLSKYYVVDSEGRIGQGDRVCDSKIMGWLATAALFCAGVLPWIHQSLLAVTRTPDFINKTGAHLGHLHTASQLLAHEIVVLGIAALLISVLLSPAFVSILGARGNIKWLDKTLSPEALEVIKNTHTRCVAVQKEPTILPNRSLSREADRSEKCGEFLLKDSSKDRGKTSEDLSVEKMAELILLQDEHREFIAAEPAANSQEWHGACADVAQEIAVLGKMGYLEEQRREFLGPKVLGPKKPFWQVGQDLLVDEEGQFFVKDLDKSWRWCVASSLGSVLGIAMLFSGKAGEFDLVASTVLLISLFSLPIGIAWEERKIVRIERPEHTAFNVGLWRSLQALKRQGQHNIEKIRHTVGKSKARQLAERVFVGATSFKKERVEA